LLKKVEPVKSEEVAAETITTQYQKLSGTHT
jgi:hypothetical protein